MDADGLKHCLTEQERSRFDRLGYFIVENALPQDLLKDLSDAADRVHERKRANGLGPHDVLFLPNFLPEDEIFLKLLDWPPIFPKVWGILGWNIYLYHAHLGVAPPPDPAKKTEKKRLGWHQDSGRVNQDIECVPRPRLSLKVGYLLSDASESGRANMYVLPGSHLMNDLRFPEDESSDPPGAVPVCAPAGSAVLFDRRLWHAASPNASTVTRKFIVYGYGYRWLRTKDDMTVQHYLEKLDPIQRQILGDGLNANGHFTPQEDDVPLRSWLRQHQPELADR